VQGVIPCKDEVDDQNDMISTNKKNLVSWTLRKTPKGLIGWNQGNDVCELSGMPLN
jgi:hypothetical protein